MSAWLYKNPTVSLEPVTMGLKIRLVGGGGKLTWNRFTGSSRLAIQTMFIPPLEGEGTPGQNTQAATAGGLAGAFDRWSDARVSRWGAAAVRTGRCLS